MNLLLNSFNSGISGSTSPGSFNGALGTPTSSPFLTPSSTQFKYTPAAPALNFAGVSIPAKQASFSVANPPPNTTPPAIATTQTNQNASLQPINNVPQSTTVQTPSSFKIDTSNITTNDLQNPGQSTAVNNAYLQAVQNLQQAQQYSPAYQAALQQYQASQLRDAQLKSNFYTGQNLPGDTLPTAQGYTTREGALNSINELAASQALNVQELVRQGNIAGATAVANAYAPQTVSPGSSLVSPVTGQQTYSGIGGLTDVQAVNTFNNLAQQYADVPGGLTYDSSQTPQQNLAHAQQLITQSPKYQSDLLINKAYAQSLNQQQSYLSTVQRAYNTANDNLGVLQEFMQQYNLNQSNVPLVNQLQNAVKAKVADPGAIAAFQTQLQGLRAEYSQVLARGGARSVETDNEAASLIPDNLSPQQLAIVAKQLQAEGQNAISEAQSSVDGLQQQLAGTMPGGLTPTSNSSNPFSAQNFFGQ